MKENFEVNIDVVPKHEQKIYEEAFKNSESYEAWEVYARFLQAHPYVKKYLSLRQENRCLYCNEKLFEDSNYNIVHHRDYLNICTLHTTIESLISVSKPTSKNQERIIKVPNCEYCKRHNEKDFNDCMDRLVLLHDNCHTKIHYDEQKQMNWKPIKYVRNQHDIKSQNPITSKKDARYIRKAPLCKKCGNQMELREGKFGKFFGCSQFPACKYTENI